MSDLDQERILDKLDKVDATVSAMTAKIDAHMARTDERLHQGDRRIDDLETRMRAAERTIPVNGEARIAVLEASMQRQKGRVSVLATAGYAIGSSSAAAVVTYLLAHH